MRLFAVATLLALVLASQALGANTARPEAERSVVNGQVVRCWASDWSVWWLRRSTAGLKLWKYGLTIDDFCWNGTQITVLRSHRFIRMYAPLWDGEHIDQERDWNARWSFRRWTQGKFTWAGPVGLATRFPEVWFKVNGAGGLQYNATCC